MNDERQARNTCGCCEGIAQSTPALIDNRPGLSAISYRAGLHGNFKESMLAALARDRRLSGLTTRDSDDFSIALLDAWAVVADVITFYQERIANESYLRTATERLSVQQMARLIGYQLSPGVAAGTYLAFTIDEPPKLPQVPVDNKVRQAYARMVPSAVKIEKGTKVQSIPGQDEQAQVFETVETIEARAEWNELKPKTTEPQNIGLDTDDLYLKGVNTQLQPGDMLLFVGDERDKYPGSERWDIRIVETVKEDQEQKHTQITWRTVLGHERPNTSPAKNPRIYAFRLRASLFGYNAPDWKAMPVSVKQAYKSSVTNDPTTWGPDWPEFDIQNVAEGIIDLDASYPKIFIGGWLALMKSKYMELYKITEVSTASRINYTLTAKVTRIKLDGREHLSWFGLRETVVLAQSELLEIAEKPLRTPIAGNSIVLDRPVPTMEKGRILIINGKRIARLRIVDNKRVVRVGKTEEARYDPMPVFVSIDGTTQTSLQAESVLEIVKPPLVLPSNQWKWSVKNNDGFLGFVTARIEQFMTEPAEDDVTEIKEVAFPEDMEGSENMTEIFLHEPLQNCYDRESVTIYANVARATHGETVKEVLGSGDASQAFQRFTLRQPPLTQVSAPSASGRESTLAVRVNDILWKEVPTLFGRGPDERIYVTRTENDGTTVIEFGDGRTGTRLPTSQEGVRALYRKGIGLGGMVRSGQISLLLDRPLGVKEVINPLPATGAEDPENLQQARSNAPLTVLTMDRVVSLQDYEDFTRAFAGIAKSLATVFWTGERRTLFITVAGPKGAEVPEGSDLHTNLTNALRDAGDTLVAVTVRSYRSVTFTVRASVKIDPDYLFVKVHDAVQEALKTRYSFDVRQFGQAVAESEVVSVIQAVPGVTAVRLSQLEDQKGNNGLVQPLRAALPEQQPDGSIAGAELLTIDPLTIVVEEM